MRCRFPCARAPRHSDRAECPDRGPRNEQACGNDERRLPVAVLNEKSKDQRRQRPPDIAGHVHHAGNRSRVLASDIHWHRPGRSDGAFQKEHGRGQAVDRDIGVLGQGGGNDESAAAQHASDRNSASRDSGAARSLEQPIRCKPADSVPNDARPQRQRSEDADLYQGEVPEFDEVGWKPAQKYPETVDVGEIGAHDRPHIGRGQQVAPRHFRAGGDVGLLDDPLRIHSADMTELCLCHQRVIFRQISIGEIPPDGPEQSNQAADVEHPLPAQGGHDDYDKGRSDGGAGTAGAMRDALHEAAFLPRKPQLHRTRGNRKRARLADAEQEAHDDKSGSAARERRCRRHERPITDDRCQYAAWSKSIAKPSARHLEYGVGPDESAEDCAHGKLVEVEFLADDRRRRRYVHPVEIGDEIHQADQQKDVPASSATACLAAVRHGITLSCRWKIPRLVQRRRSRGGLSAAYVVMQWRPAQAAAAGRRLDAGTVGDVKSGATGEVMA